MTGSQSFYDLTLGGNWTYVDVNIDSATTLTVNHTLNLPSTAYYGQVGVYGGNIAAKGDVVVATGDGGARGTTVLTMSGTGTQTLTGGGSTSHLPPLVINKSSGTLHLVGTISTSGDWTYIAGTVDPGTSTVQLINGDYQALTVTGSQNFYDLTLGGQSLFSSVTIDSATTLTIEHTLNLAGNSNYYAKTYLVGGNLAAKGDVVVGDAGANGSTLLTFTGSAGQTWSSAGGLLPGEPITVDKPSGSVTLATDIAFSAAQTLRITSGTFDQGASYSFQSSGVSIAASGVWRNAGSGAVTLDGDVANAGAVSFSGGGPGCGTDDILLRSSSSGTQRSWSGTGTFALEDVDIQDQGGSAAIIAHSSTNRSGNGANFTFSASCSSAGSAPTDFNAFESATANGAVVGNIHTKVAASSFTIDVVALASGSVLTTVTGDVKVEIVDASDNTGAMTGSCRSSWPVLSGNAGTTITLVGGDNGRKAVALAE